MSGERVHIRNRDGRPIYNRLTREPNGTMRFEVWGFVTEDQVRREGWQVVPGWIDAATWDKRHELAESEAA